MIVDILGLTLVSALVGESKVVSVIFFAIGIGLICALYELNVKKRLVLERKWLLVIESGSVICFTSAFIGDMSDWLVVITALGACGIMIVYNQTQKSTTSAFFFMSSLACMLVPICLTLNVLRLILFCTAGIAFFGALFIRKVEPVYK